MSMLVLLVSCRCMVAFHASTVGATSLSGRMWGPTFCARQVPVDPGAQGPKNGRIPLDGITGNWFGAGPVVKLKAGVLLSFVGPLMFWLARTGRFCVTVCPNSEPKTPISKLRPYPTRTTVLGLIS